jgi:hypothetical protein
MPKYVAATTLRALGWQTAQLLEGPVPEAVATLEQSDGGPILVAGSRTLVHTLLEAGLVDPAEPGVDVTAPDTLAGVTPSTASPGGASAGRRDRR